jgi:DNA-3-methyladenine glycosylase I
MPIDAADRLARLPRCAWAKSDPLSMRYHDEEWGVPSHDDRHLFEMLLLEGAQAGLSWVTILRKREGYRRAFDGFDARRIARYDARKVRSLLADESIVRNRSKIDSAIANARAFLDVQADFGSFDRFVWSFVGGEPIVKRRRTTREVPARTPESDAMSRVLRRRGFRFVGPTICYAFMQATGLVDDHVVTCFRASRTPGRRARLPRPASAERDASPPRRGVRAAPAPAGRTHARRGRTTRGRSGRRSPSRPPP